MAVLRPKTGSPSLSFRLRFPKVVAELERETLGILEGSWDSGDMERASEIAGNLAEACRVEGLREAAAMARSIASLMKVPPEQIRPILVPFREKLDELLGYLRSSVYELLSGAG